MRSDRSKHRSASKIRSVLVLARPLSDIEDLLEPLLRRSDIGLFRAASVEGAQIALGNVRVSLVLVGDETEAAMVNSMLDATDELRPKTPVLLLRDGGSAVPAGWRGRIFAVLRCPVLPDVLSKTVDVALGLGPLPH